MRYHQPLDQPGAPNAVWLNADLDLGEEGSVLDAKAVEYPQREIVEVIQFAANLGLPGCVAPTDSDLTQLRKAIQGFLAQRYINTPVIKTVHGSGADFADLHAAFEWVAQYIITQAGYVTFVVAQGKWTYSSKVYVNHHNSDRIEVQGHALLGAAPTTATFTYTGRHSASDGSADITALRAIFATELSFTGGIKGIHIVQPGITFRYLLITGTQTITETGPGAACGIFATANVNLDTISIWGFGKYGLLAEQCDVEIVTSAALCVVYCNDSGIVLWGAMVGFIGDVIAINNGNSGLVALQSVVTNSPSGGSGRFYCRYNAAHGLQVTDGGSCASAAGSVFDDNGGNGVVLAGASTVNVNNAEIARNVQWGFNAQGGFGYVGGTAAFSSNGSGSISASLGANVYATGASGLIGTTPPLNTVGNGNAYISG